MIKDPESESEVISSEILDFSKKTEDPTDIGSRWVDNEGKEVKDVFGFNSNAELVNGRAAMFGFLMLIITELMFKGVPATKSIFGIN